MPHRTSALAPPLSLSILAITVTLALAACVELTVGERPKGGVCEPFAAEPCYTGAAETRGIGACREGVHVCKPDGSGYGACEGEVAPSAEDCSTAADEDCNGKAGDDQAAGCACEPGVSAVCYTGPEGTKDVGVCREGVALCDASGQAFGPCEGEVTPTAEACGLPTLDETCDGEALCNGDPVSARRYGDIASQYAYAINVSPDGAVLLAGRFNGTLDFGDKKLTNSSAPDAFVASIGADDKPRWSRSFGDVFVQEATGIARDPEGNAVVIGNFVSTINFGTDDTTELTSEAGTQDVFVAKLDGESGDHLWSKAFPGADTQILLSVAVDAEGNILLCGYFVGDIDFTQGAGEKLVSAGSNDAFVAKLDKNGGHVWSKRFGDAASQICSGIHADAGGNTFVTGTFQGTLDTGGGVALTSPDAGDIFVVKIAPDGSVAWAKAFGGMGGDQTGEGIATDVAGNIYVGGRFDGFIDFGGGTPLGGLGSADVFAMKLDKDGNHIWSRSFGSAGFDRAHAIAVDGAGNLLVAGHTYGDSDFGGGPQESPGGYDGFLMKLDNDGSLAFGRLYGGGATDAIRGMGVDALGGAVVVGDTQGMITFGKTVLGSAGAEDIFVARLRP